MASCAGTEGIFVERDAERRVTTAEAGVVFVGGPRLVLPFVITRTFSISLG
jgi:hypothetical protein